ncbi:MAG: 50S ribosomal protein L10 [Streptosporangiaceae bacterium]
MARPDKVAAVADIKEELKSSGAILLAEYRGLSVPQMQELRRSLGDGARFRVTKNTLTTIAAREVGMADALEHLLEGPSAVTFVKGDPVEAARTLRNFARSSPLELKGGIFEGRSVTAEDIGNIADLDSREVLLAKLAGAMKATTSHAAATFNAPLEKAVRLAEALRKKREREGGQEAP